MNLKLFQHITFICIYIYLLSNFSHSKVKVTSGESMDPDQIERQQYIRGNTRPKWGVSFQPTFAILLPYKDSSTVENWHESNALSKVFYNIYKPDCEYGIYSEFNLFMPKYKTHNYSFLDVIQKSIDYNIQFHSIFKNSFILNFGYSNIQNYNFTEQFDYVENIFQNPLGLNDRSWMDFKRLNTSVSYLFENILPKLSLVVPIGWIHHWKNRNNDKPSDIFNFSPTLFWDILPNLFLDFSLNITGFSQQKISGIDVFSGTGPFARTIYGGSTVINCTGIPNLNLSFGTILWISGRIKTNENIEIPDNVFTNNTWAWNPFINTLIYFSKSFQLELRPDAFYIANTSLKSNSTLKGSVIFHYKCNQNRSLSFSGIAGYAYRTKSQGFGVELNFTQLF